MFYKYFINTFAKQIRKHMKTYFFKITSKQNGQLIGTGSFKVSKEMSKEEQISFFHEYTNGVYSCSVNYFKIEIN